jgi:hypothetical protein
MVSRKSERVGRPAPAPEHQAAAAASPETTESLVLVTLKANTGTIVKVEAVEPDGSRHEIAPSDMARLLASGRQATLQSLMHEAFEAGLACLLGGGSERREPDEPAAEGSEDDALHDVLLETLIAKSPAKRLMQPDVLNSAMLRTIISEAPGAHTPAR